MLSHRALGWPGPHTRPLGCPPAEGVCRWHLSPLPNGPCRPQLRNPKGSRQRPVGGLEGALDRGLGSRLVSVLPHPVWEPEGRAGLRPQSLARREGPGELGRRGWEGSWLPGPRGPPACLVPTAWLPRLLGANARCAARLRAHWGLPWAGAGPHGCKAALRDWATSRDWSRGLVGPVGPSSAFRTWRPPSVAPCSRRPKEGGKRLLQPLFWEVPLTGF